jgi:hypothetical protein
VKRLLVVLALAFFGFTAFGDEPDLIEGAKRATAYWNSVFARCGNQGQRMAWYAVIPDGPSAGSIQMVPQLTIHFKTEELSKEQRLNGFVFRATTSVEPGPFRWWISKNRAWREWQVGEIAAPAVLIKKNGIWSQEMAAGRTEDRKALTTCSQIQPMEEEKR